MRWEGSGVRRLGLASAALLALMVVAIPTAQAQQRGEERWDSDYGPVVLTYSGLGQPGAAVSVTGYFLQPQGSGGCSAAVARDGACRGEIGGGTYDAGTRTLRFSYSQYWNNQNGSGTFQIAVDGLSAAGTYSQASSSGRWNLSRGTPSLLLAERGPAAAAAPEAVPAAAAPAASGEASDLFDNWNKALVENGPSAATIFRFDQRVLVTRITTYHWNDGRGAVPGSIALRGADGTLFGPWGARGTSGTGGAQNVNWVVEPNIVLPPGSYTVVDSQPETWSRNAQSAGRGFASVQGKLPVAMAEVPAAVRAAIAAQGYYEEVWESDWGPTTLYFVGIIEPPGGQLAVAGTWQQPAGMGACAAVEGYCIGQIDGGVFDLATGTLQFKYFQPWNQTLGAGSLQLGADGMSLAGTYTHEGGASGAWTLRRSEPCVAAR